MNDHRRYWIEMSVLERRFEGENGEFQLGKGLLSPQRSKNGRDIYGSMRDVRREDIVLHFTDNKAITGLSVVESDKVDDSYVWNGKPAYRISLKDFVKIDPLHRKNFLEAPQYKWQLLAIIQPGRKLFYSRELKINQWAYITEVPEELLAILGDAYQSVTGTDLYLLMKAMAFPSR